MPSFRAHSVRFYKLEAKAITCIAHSSSHSLLAVARSDSTVEIWSTRVTPVLLYIIHPPPHQEDISVESLAWAGDRLFSCGLHGQVVEYNLDSRQEAKRYPVTSGPAWCLAIDRGCSKLAVGTEDGFVCLFSITEEGLDYEKVLDRQEGRILCVSWHPDNIHVVTGSTDTVRMWNTETGHPTARMVTGRSEKNKETIVWCVAVTSDMTVISGDSRGKTSFWNGKTGTLMDSIQSHKADVLTLTLSSDESTAYSTGVDPTLMHFQTIVRNDGRRKWVKSIHRVISGHDVRSVICADNMLYSGGVDTYLTLHNYPTYRTTYRIPPLPPHSTASKIAREARCLLLTYSQALQLWKLGKSNVTTGAIGSVLPMDGDEPCKLVEVGVKQGESIICSSVHTSGQYIAYSTNARLRLLQITGVDEKTPSVSKVALSDSTPCHHVCLWSDQLMTLDQTGARVYSIGDNNAATLSHTLSLSQLSLTRGIARVCHSNTTAVLVDNTDTVVCLSLKNFTLISQLPGYTEANISAIGLSPDSSTCFIAYSNNKLVEVDVKSGKFTKFSRQDAGKLPKSWLSRRTPVTNVVHVAGNSDLVLMHDHNILAVLDKDKEMPEPSSKLYFTDPRATPDTGDSASVSSFGSQLTSGSKLEQSLSAGLRLSRKFDHLLSLHHLDKDEIVAVEVKPSVIESQLPPSLKQKKFGVS